MNGGLGIDLQDRFPRRFGCGVPMLVRTPATARDDTGRISDTLVENCDLGPTLVELAGGRT